MFRNRILMSILTPVAVVGLVITAVVIGYLMPQLEALLKSQTDVTLILAGQMAADRCDESFDYLTELRLEDDPEMNEALRQQTLLEIRAIHDRLPKIHLLVIENGSKVVASTWNPPPRKIDIAKFLIPFGTKEREIDLGKERVRVCVHYFPFWRWHIVSLITNADYLVPVRIAKKIVYAGTLGVFIATLLACLAAFYYFVNLPLKRIVQATERVADGKLIPIYNRRRDEIGQVAAAFNEMVHSLRDDRKHLREILVALRESEELYRLITEQSLTHVTITREGEIIYANRKVLDSTGYSMAELIGKEIWSFAHPEDRKMVRGRSMALAMGKSGTDHYEYRYLTSSGEVRWIEVLAVPTSYKGKSVILTHGIDITERKQIQKIHGELEEKLQRAQKMEAIGILAGGVAHDLNNILSGIVSYPELLLMNLPQDSPLRKPLLTIQDAGQRAAAVVQDLLTLARRGVATMEAVNLNTIVREYMESPVFQRLKDNFPQVRVRVDLADDLLNILGSPVHLSKTLMNLVANAVEAAVDGGEVLIATENRYIDKPIAGYDDVKEGDFAVLSVVDTGIGIPAEDLPRIFEPFYTKKVMGRSGTGLGMAVVWGTVKDHQAYIDVESQMGEGTRFDLFFPVTRQRISDQDRTFDPRDYSGTEHVLVVDDVAEQREIASEFLRTLGYSVITASSGEEAVSIMEKNSVDLVLLDMIMDPGIDGLETYKRLVRINPGLKAVIASGFSETEKVRETQRLGAGRYIKKPYTLEKLGLAVRFELDRREEGRID